MPKDAEPCRESTAERRRIRRAPGQPNSSTRSPIGPATAVYTSPTGFSGVPPPGPATPVIAIADVRAEPLARALRHRRAPFRRHRAVLLDQLGRYAELRDLDLVRVRDDPAEEDVARARDSREELRDRPPVQDSAVASVSPRVAARLEHDLRDRPLVLGEEVLGQLARAASTSGGSSPAPTRVDVDLEVAGADGRLHPAPLAAGVREHARDCRLLTP